MGRLCLPGHESSSRSPCQDPGKAAFAEATRLLMAVVGFICEGQPWLLQRRWRNRRWRIRAIVYIVQKQLLEAVSKSAMFG